MSESEPDPALHVYTARSVIVDGFGRVHPQPHL
jgi:hypothetical protein